MLDLTRTVSYIPHIWKKQRYFHYYKYGILNLLKSFNSWNPNKPLTVEQLKTINDIIKTVYFFVQKDKECKKCNQEQTLDILIKKDYDFAFSVEDKFFGIGLSKEDNDNKYDKCIFIQPNNNGLFAVQSYDKTVKKSIKKDVDNKSFRNFIDAVKLCSTKKLPISFIDKNGIIHNNPCLITHDEYKNLLVILIKDFWNAFHGEYKYDLLRLSEKYPNNYTMEIKSDEEYKKIKQKDNRTGEEKDALDRYSKKVMLQKIKKAFTDDYDEKNFIEIFGEETINNIRYIIYNLIDIEMPTNNFLINKIKMDIENILSNNAIEYDNKDIDLEKLINYVMNDLINNNFTSIIKSISKNISYQNEELVEDIISLINENENILDTQRFYDYIYKLLYYKPLEKYIKENMLLNVIKSSKINEKFIRHLLKKNIKNKIPTIINSFLYSHDIKDVDKMILEIKNTKKVNKYK